MSENIWQKKLDDASQRVAALEQAMADASGASDTQQGTQGKQEDWQALAVEHGRLAPLARAHQQWQAAQTNVRELRELLADPEVGALAQDELAAAEEKRQAVWVEVSRLLSPDQAADTGDCFLEIRAAVGGNESCLFAADLLRMYLRAADLHGWKTESLSHSEGEVGGYKEAIIKVAGKNAYGRLKYESGAHRVQRVPQTESQGRVHTSVVTVAVIAVAGDDDPLVLNPADLRIETFRASGAGGQHVNTTDSAVRITHLPTETVAECQDERSQHKNRDKAMAVLRARIIDKRRREQKQKEDSERRELVGSGERSDRIRTYNFPQGRMTDHRIGLTLYKLPQIMEGEVGEVFDALAKADAIPMPD